MSEWVHLNQKPEPPPKHKHLLGRRRTLLLLALALVPLAVAVGAWLSFSYDGRRLTAQVLEVSGQWPQAVRAPEQIIAHRVSDDDQGQQLVPGWHSAERRILKPGTDEWHIVGSLFDEGKLSRDAHQLYDCEFHGDFALEFVLGVTRRVAVFDLRCFETRGDASIHTFDPRAVGAFARELFPDDEAFTRAAKGEQVRQPEPP